MIAKLEKRWKYRELVVNCSIEGTLDKNDASQKIQILFIHL